MRQQSSSRTESEQSSSDDAGSKVNSRANNTREGDEKKNASQAKNPDSRGRDYSTDGLESPGRFGYFLLFFILKMLSFLFQRNSGT